MSAIMVLLLRRAGHKSIDVFKMRRGGVETDAIDASMLVFTNTDGFAGQSDQPLNVELTLIQDFRNAASFKDDHLAALRLAEIVGYAIDEQMVASGFLETQNGFTLVKCAAQSDA